MASIKDIKAPMASTESAFFWSGSDEELDCSVRIPLSDPDFFPSPKKQKEMLASAKYKSQSNSEDDSFAGSEDSRTDERGGWGNKLDFLFSCISVSVGLGNVWRFPYLCYKNGGGAFLVTYGIAMMLCGIPLFFQEVAIGQYLGSGGMSLVSTLCPILGGAGYATMTIVFLLDVYYCIIIAWTLFYLINTFTMLPDLPWQHCGNWWNSEKCYEGSENHTASEIIRSQLNQTSTPVEEFWEKRVLMITDGIHDLGGMQWELFGCLVLGWLLVYFIIWKGLHQSGKIIWFSALFPYVIMIILLVRAVTLQGALNGLSYFIKPDWSKLTSSGAWIDGATQIFFGYSIGVGTLPALGSFNKFHHNCYKDAIITCVINTLTCLLAGCIVFSILGYIAFVQDAEVGDVVKSGPGLVFLTYPEVVLKLPGSVAWATIFFVMLAILGIDSEFCNVEAFITGVVDHFSTYLRPIRRKFTLGVCLLMLALGTPMVTKGGAYVFQLMDFYSASGISLLWVCFFQTIAISWFFGADRFCDCIEEMIGFRPGMFWTVCWVYLAPASMLSIFLFYCAQYVPVTYGASYEYPDWAEVIGLCLCFSSMIWIPAYAIYYVLCMPGTIMENIKAGFKPTVNKASPSSMTASKAAPGADSLRPPHQIPVSESKAVLITHQSGGRAQE
ncbi:sodium- and chloride-dependent GABA transporter 1-like isoform X2 [Neocloeon triangulifer]|uniref:sodium- and chloride-dependent GABA transporter 1-like isoform X2 n=1 Tax=Neocloeon triangulifer TaxID=2078957 RepID=UPI00286F355A|nr:sodium- and chloride-dependent GABA transporter 1-like isoform X2 [Neocloeon triangulifer]